MDIYETTNGKFIIATERNGQFTAAMTSEAARLTGCTAVTSREIDDVAASPNVRKYASLSAARSALRAIIDGE